MNADTRTHYVPFFAKRDTTVVRHDGQGRLEAVCGAWAWPEQHRIDPAELGCWGCRMWMENLHLIEPETANELRTA